MAVRTSVPGTVEAGDAATADGFANKLPGGWIGYAIATATQSAITSEVDLTSLTVTVTVGASRLLKITGFIPAIEPSVADGRLVLRIKESTTVLGQGVAIMRRTGASFAECIALALVVAPSAGAHTYKLSGESDQGGNATLNLSATAPGYLLVEDLGSST